MNVPFRERIACTVPEACAATGLRRSKLYEEMAAGRIQSTAVGKRRLVLVASLLSLLENQPWPTTRQRAPARKLQDHTRTAP